MDQTENKENMEAMEEEQIVVITDDEGNELYFREEMVVPVGKKNFAILAQINLEDCECEDEDCHCHEHEEDEEENVIIARIEFGEAPRRSARRFFSCARCGKSNLFPSASRPGCREGPSYANGDDRAGDTSG